MQVPESEFKEVELSVTLTVDQWATIVAGLMSTDMDHPGWGHANSAQPIIDAIRIEVAQIEVVDDPDA